MKINCGTFKAFVPHRKRNEMKGLTVLAICVGLCGVAQSTDCPNGWMAFEGSCYLFGVTQMNFADAQKFCKQNGAYVAHPHNAEENAFLIDVIKDYKGTADYWMGITDRVKEGTWKNADTGVAATFFNWHQGEPDGASRDYEEDCVFALHEWGYKWADVPCDDNNRPICVRRGGSPSMINIG